MTRTLRALGGITLWVAAVLGVLTCGVWAATALGWIKPLIVVSGSMEPEIPTGALVIDTPVAVEDLAVGNVVTVYSDLADNLVTHRVAAVDVDGSTATLTLKGDANPIEDPEPYVVEDETWTVSWVIPGLGEAIADVSRPGVVIPAMIAIGALLGLSLLRDRDDDADGEPEDDASADAERPAARSGGAS
ncbi:signal peptidase I [Demequina sp. NBRC 110057]|uniref:signal peptidase I n=1 Tax=Demequina sp. NBRC 110057 TaxID=1570346 RepID=UPI000A022BFD|nr:signal peptidase I [Demequina sp. NBRC 110057]